MQNAKARRRQVGRKYVGPTFPWRAEAPTDRSECKMRRREGGRSGGSFSAIRESEASEFAQIRMGSRSEARGMAEKKNNRRYRRNEGTKRRCACDAREAGCDETKVR